MPDPITPDHYRAQVVFHGNSGLPRDVFVNSMVFRNDLALSEPQGMHDTVKTDLNAFYGVATPSANRIASFLAGWAWNRVELRTYDLGQAPPRDPISSDFDISTWGIPEASLGMPFEVALCVTWHTAVNRPWGRGRTYLGPFIASANTGSESSGPVPTPAVLTTISEAAARLLGSTSAGLTILGKLGPNRVTNGYVDNAWDTQRRRGVDATARTTFVKP